MVQSTAEEAQDFDPFKIERPDPILFRYYVFASLLSGPLFPLVLAPLWFRYLTLRYKFDESGVSMRWGILFRREVTLTYRRIQDIHLTRNILQRWMGLAKISLQTASGNNQAEMTIEGVLEAEELRDFLYSQMRGAKNELTSGDAAARDAMQSESQSKEARVTQALEDIRTALQTLVQQRSGE
ncbi:MAG: PH domain-containing protein [bacterium]|nr:PH domain-containing protein [bacterium]